MANMIIRKNLSDQKLTQWELAEALGIAEFTLCRKLRRELPTEEKERYLEVVAEMAAKKAGAK